MRTVGAAGPPKACYFNLCSCLWCSFALGRAPDKRHNVRMEKVDVLVVGAGAVGLAVGRALAMAGREVIVLEREKAIGQGVSSRNSEVIHSGLYYPTGSLKAQLCVRGKLLAYDFLREHGVAHVRCGKWVVATDPSQVAALRQLQRQAQINGVPTEWLAGAQAAGQEPQLHCLAALSSPSTGLMDSHGFMVALQGDMERAGGVVALDSQVSRMRVSPDGLIVHTQSSNGQETEVLAKAVVNAASLNACELALKTEGLAAHHVPKAYFAKGSYFSVTGKAPFSRLIYPIPGPASLGTHYTLDLGGQGKFGPDIEWLDIDSPQQIDYAVNPARASSFYEGVRHYWPGLLDGTLQASYSGVRPKIHGPDQPAADFLLQTQAQHGVRGLVNLFGIESPGLTSSMAIGEWVAKHLT
jgi:L-2-hydroxyglutarate oxidase LhgO